MKMNTIQVADSQPGIYVKNILQLHRSPPKPCILSMNANPFSGTSLRLREKPSPVLQYVPILKSRQPLHVCFAGGKGMMENNNEWKPLEKAMEKFKGQSIEDIIRQQIQKGENGGGGAKPPGQGGGGGGGGGPGESGDGRFAGMLDETLQVVLATIGFIFMYLYVINGLELTKLAMDFIKFIFSGNQSVRLKRAMYNLTRFYKNNKNMTEKKEADKKGLEEAPEDPNYYQDVDRNYMKSNSYE